MHLLEAWQEFGANNPSWKGEPDVEALMVNRISDAREFYRVPIDECYKLVGLIRANWRSLGGGKYGDHPSIFCKLNSESHSRERKFHWLI